MQVLRLHAACAAHRVAPRTAGVAPSLSRSFCLHGLLTHNSTGALLLLQGIVSIRTLRLPAAVAGAGAVAEAEVAVEGTLATEWTPQDWPAYRRAALGEYVQRINVCMPTQWLDRRQQES